MKREGSEAIGTWHGGLGAWMSKAMSGGRHYHCILVLCYFLQGNMTYKNIRGCKGKVSRIVFASKDTRAPCEMENALRKRHRLSSHPGNHLSAPPKLVCRPSEGPRMLGMSC